MRLSYAGKSLLDLSSGLSVDYDVAVFSESHHLLGYFVDVLDLVSESFFELSYALDEVLVVLQEVLSHDEQIVVAYLFKISLHARPDLMLGAEQRELQL